MARSVLPRTVLAATLAASLALPATVAAQAAPANTTAIATHESPITLGLRGGTGLTLTDGDTGGYVGFTLMLTDPQQKISSLKVTLVEQGKNGAASALASETHTISEFSESPFEGLEQVYSFTFSGTLITQEHTYQLVFEAYDAQGKSITLPTVDDAYMQVLPNMAEQPTTPTPSEEPAPTATETPAPVVTAEPSQTPAPAQTELPAQQPTEQTSSSAWNFFTSLVGKVVKGFIGFLGHIFG